MSGVFLLACESEASYGRRSVAGEAPSTMHFRSFLKMTLEMRAVAMAKPLTALHLYRVFSRQLVG